MVCYNSKVLLKNLPVEENNNLANLKFHTTPGGIRLIHASATLIDKEDSTDKGFKFTTKDFYNAIEDKPSSKSDKLKKICKELLRGYFSLKTKDSWKISPMFYNIEYDDVKDNVMVQFHEALIPYLSCVGTSIQSQESLNNIINFKSKYSMMIYNICKKNISPSDDIAEMSIDVEELRAKLGISEKKYIKYNDFKRKVLVQAEKEINDKADISFCIEEEIVSRKVKGIKFKIKNKPVNTENNTEA
ncbi:replication initiation protein [Clostridium sp. PL3]|uniref:Replication initiation protein n=1 Tax=Clostridium thailandense TaxID=2794346 RepID=A0A949WRT5_9CLOT|nr:replication initiation protein [Clostridium thailandense]MBV7274400.1 replication initiation protein [Clostridium thailandense]